MKSGFGAEAGAGPLGPADDPGRVASGGGEGGGHFGSYLEAAGADRGTEDRMETRGRGAGRAGEGAGGLGGDSRGGAAPAGVGPCDRAGDGIREEHRHAVGSLDRHPGAGRDRDEPVGLRWGGG